MNDFVKEVSSQGTALMDLVHFYRNEGHEILDYLKELFDKNNFKRLIFTGMGSSLSATETIRGFLVSNKKETLAYSSSELLNYMFNLIDSETLVFAVSQSGNSREVLELIRNISKITPVIGITNNNDSPLAQQVPITLPLKAGIENSITSKSYENTILLLNIISHHLLGQLDSPFWNEVSTVIDWINEWMSDLSSKTNPLFHFARNSILFDMIAEGPSLATAKQLSLAYREGLNNCSAVWELADYAHGQYHSSKMGRDYLAQMFVPFIEKQSTSERMIRYILEHDGRVIVYSVTELGQEEGLRTVKMPNVRHSLIPLVESAVSETLLGLLLGPNWTKKR